MNSKKTWKRFWTLSRHHEAGFTLVELIVVIAILAILAGVAVPAYSGYVRKANKTADQTLVSQIRNAMDLAYYSEEGFDSVVGGVCITPDETSIVGYEKGTSGYTMIATALSNAFGSGWESLKLSYDGWTGGKTTAAALANFSSWEGTALAALVAEGDALVSPSYKNEIEDMFGLIETVAVDMGDKLGESGASLVQIASGVTVGSDADAADAFARVYATEEWTSAGLQGLSGGLTDDVYVNVGEEGFGEELINQAVANAAVIKARNTAFANYLRQNNMDEEFCSLIENLTLGTSGYKAYVPADFVTADSVYSYFDENPDAYAKYQNALNSYWSYDTDISESQAYKDGLAYYAMMDTVNAVSDVTGADDDTYWSDLTDAVELYADIARGEIVLADMTALQAAINGISDENAVFVTVVNGKVSVAPGSILG